MRYTATLMGSQHELAATLELEQNPRYIVVGNPDPETGIGVIVGLQELPDQGELPEGTMMFHRLGSAVHTSKIKASVLYEFVGHS